MDTRKGCTWLLAELTVFATVLIGKKDFIRIEFIAKFKMISLSIKRSFFVLAKNDRVKTGYEISTE